MQIQNTALINAFEDKLKIFAKLTLNEEGKTVQTKDLSDEGFLQLNQANCFNMLAYQMLYPEDLEGAMALFLEPTIEPCTFEQIINSGKILIMS